MPFESGENWKGNRLGRKPDKVSYNFDLRKQITEYCRENLSFYLEELRNQRPGFSKTKCFLELLSYSTPKITESNSKIDILSLSGQEVDHLLDEIKRSVE